MAVILLDNQTAAAATGNSITVTLNTAPIAGDSLIAFVGHSDDYPAVPSGWTQIAESVQTGVLRAFYKVATGSEGTSLAFTSPTTGGFTARVLRYSGLGTLDAVGGNASSGTNQILFGTATTTTPTTLLFASGLLHGNSLPISDMTWSNSFTPLAADVRSPSGGKQAQLGLALFNATSAAGYTTIASYTPTATTGVEGLIVAFVVPPPTAGNVYFRRNSAWVHSTVARKVRVSGAWVTL